MQFMQGLFKISGLEERLFVICLSFVCYPGLKNDREICYVQYYLNLLTYLIYFTYLLTY